MKTSGVMVRMERELEIALVGRLRAGDVLAFDAVYDDYNPRLLGFLLRMTKNRAAAEDLLEETWLRLVSGGEELAADTPSRTLAIHRGTQPVSELLSL